MVCREKRVLSILLALMMLLSAAGAVAGAPEESEFYDGAYTWRILEDGSACLVYYDGVAREVEIPAELGGLPVTAMQAFCIRDQWLETVTLPNSVTRFIHGNPFANCEALKEIRVAEDHPTMAVEEGLLLTREDHHLLCCPAQTAKGNYTIPEIVQGLDSMAFYGCAQLNRVTISASVVWIGARSPFSGCAKLNQIQIPEDHPALKLENDLLINTVQNQVVCAQPGKKPTEAVIPEGTKEICGYAFSGCDKLKSVSFPAGLETIGDYAFFSCSALSEALLPDGLKTIGDSAFANDKALVSLTLPEGLESIGDGAFESCSALSVPVILPDSIASLGAFAFGSCASLPEITLSAGLKSLEYATFWYCSSLGTVNIPDGLERIDDLVFMGSGIQELMIPDSVVEIGYRAFTECMNLTKLKLPAHVKELPTGLCFYDMLLSEVELPEDLETIGYMAFYGCSSLGKITLPDSLRAIEPRAFEASSVWEARVPASLEYIGFDNDFESLIVPEGSVIEHYCRLNGIEIQRP